MGETDLGFQKLASVSWYYVASLLIIGLYFKFNRFWSVRNLDILLIVLIAPGALMVSFGEEQRYRFLEQQVLQRTPEIILDQDADSGTAGGDSTPNIVAQTADSDEMATNPSSIDNQEYLRQLLSQPPAKSDFADNPEFRSCIRLMRNGFLWLFAVGLLLLIRVLLDPGFVRRPLLESNLTVGGLAFLGCSLLAFVLIDVSLNQPVFEDNSGARHMIQMVKGEAVEADDRAELMQHGPGYALMHLFPAIPTFVSLDGKYTGPTPEDSSERSYQLEFITKALAIASLLGVVIGLLLIGHWHFGNFNLGVTVATLLLMSPYTSHSAGQVFHVLPSLLLVWAIVSYRKPIFSGMLIGLAAGVFYYPMFLLPLWFSYYWDRGRYRFFVGFLISIGLVVGSLIFVTTDVNDFFQQLRVIFGFWFPKVVGVRGIWVLGWDPWFRLPLLAGFFGLSFSFALWPIRKDLGTLISCTAAVMLALQFCHGFGGGTYIAWYLPLLLLTVFRPGTVDKIAVNDVSEKWMLRPGPASA